MDGLPASLEPRLAQRARRAAAWVHDQRAAGRAVTVVHHIDADGVCAGAIALEALHRAGVVGHSLPVKSLDAVHLQLIRDSGAQALWFGDLGSTAYMHFPDLPRLVCDHHELVRDGSEEDFPHVNPLLDDGAGDGISGAGCAYLVAAALDDRNVDLLPLALVGASADLQDRQQGLHGPNRALLEQGQELGLLELRADIAWFGSETRPLRKFLSLGREPSVPGLDGRAAERLCKDAGVAMTDERGERSWARLDDAERMALRNAIVTRLLDLGRPAAEVDRLLREVITIRAEGVATPTRELQEFGTLLNSTARYGQAAVGLAVARGDRGAAYREALDLLLDHRKHLVGALDVFARSAITEMQVLQWLHLRDQVLDTVVGIVCGMALESLGLRRDLVLVAFAWTPDGRSKASARAPHGLQQRGIDLAVAMRSAAESVGGQGGGHRGAAGATVPRGQEWAFVNAVDAILRQQVGGAALSGQTTLPA